MVFCWALVTSKHPAVFLAHTAVETIPAAPGKCEPILQVREQKQRYVPKALLWYPHTEASGHRVLPGSRSTLFFEARSLVEHAVPRFGRARNQQTPETLLSLSASAGVTEGPCPSWGLKIQTQSLGFEKHFTHEAAPPIQIAKR